MKARVLDQTTVPETDTRASADTDAQGTSASNMRSGDEFDSLLRAPASAHRPAAEYEPSAAAAVASSASSTSVPADTPQVLEVDVDGKRVRIVARDEIVLECGNASITLRRNGRVVIKGTYIETYSEGTNRIKGGQVRIN